MRIVWTYRARRDLDRIYDFYKEKNSHVAVEIWNEIVSAADILLLHPNIAPKEPLLADFENDHRSLVVYSGLFKLIYFVEKGEVVITRVWVCRQNPKNI